MIAGGGSHFRAGVHDFGDQRTDVDLYSTVARALGIGETFGDARHFTGHLAGLA
jgi:hypothetical protein